MKKTILSFLLFISFCNFNRGEEVFYLDVKDAPIGNLSDQALKEMNDSIYWTYLMGRASVVTDELRGNVLQIYYPKNGFGPEGSGSQFLAGLPPRTHYYLDYYLKFNEDFDFKIGGKLPGLTSGGSTYTGGTDPVNGEGWSARYMWSSQTNNDAFLYLYYIDQQDTYGEAVYFGKNFKKGQWQRITQEIKVNDENQNNAEIKVWLDGQLVVHKKDFRLRVAPNGLIDSFYFSTFFGGSDASWAPARDSRICFDEIRVTTEVPDFLRSWDEIEGNKNLPATTTPRIPTTAKTWPSRFGESSVCLWKNDKTAAFSITIDDNIETEVEFWGALTQEFNIPVSWFLITTAKTWPDYDNMGISDNTNVQNMDPYIQMLLAGNFIEAHDDRNWYKNPPADKPNKDEATYRTRLAASRQIPQSAIESFDGRVLSYAYPFGEGNETWAAKEFVAIRGTNGVLNQADKVNYLNVNSVSSPHLVADKAKYIEPLIDTTKTLYGVNYYHGWGCTHFHGLYNEASKTAARDLFVYLDERKDELWLGGFSEIACYAQSRDTHDLSSDSISSTEIHVTLTDNMSDELYTGALTVKVKVGNNWNSLTATQNGQELPYQFIEHEGKKYALIDIYPNGNTVTIIGVPDDDPAVFDPIAPLSVSAGNRSEVDFAAATQNGAALSFSFENLPAFVETEVEGNGGKLIIAPETGDEGEYTFYIIADNGTSKTSCPVSLTVTSNENVIIVYADKADANVYSPEHNFVDPADRTNIMAGGSYVKEKHFSAIFPFLLPELPQGKIIDHVSFNAYLESFNNPQGIIGTIDLYALPAREAATVLLTDGYMGSFSASDVNGIHIQEHFSDVQTELGVVSSNENGNSALTNYINDCYNNGKTGHYAFLRLSTSHLEQLYTARTFYTSADGAETTGQNSRYPTLYIHLKNGSATDCSPTSQGELCIVEKGEQCINIRLPEDETGATISLYNMQGQLVYSETANGNIHRIDTTLLPAGVYVLSANQHKLKIIL